VIKPMNCPGSMLMYKEEAHSYRELPIKIGEIGLVHRKEKSGELSGLLRVAAFHQDDAHIFMTKEQITEEVLEVIKLIDKIYKTFGFEYHVELSTRPKKSIGTDEHWEFTTSSLKKSLEKWSKNRLSYKRCIRKNMAVRNNTIRYVFARKIRFNI